MRTFAGFGRLLKGLVGSALCDAARCGVMTLRRPLEALHPHIFRMIALDLPGLLFFSTYSLLVLFWAEIYHQVRPAFVLLFFSFLLLYLRDHSVCVLLLYLRHHSVCVYPIYVP
jgi:hypothetical protein